MPKDPDSTIDKEGNTKLHIAARDGDHDEVKDYMKKSLSLTDINHDEWMPIHYAADGGHFRIVEWMISIEPTLVNAQTAYGYTPLYLAAGKVNMQLIIYLLQHKADPLLDTNGSKTPLDALCEASKAYATAASLKALTSSNQEYDAISLIGALEQIQES